MFFIWFTSYVQINIYISLSVLTKITAASRILAQKGKEKLHICLIFMDVVIVVEVTVFGSDPTVGWRHTARWGAIKHGNLSLVAKGAGAKFPVVPWVKLSIHSTAKAAVKRSFYGCHVKH